MKCEKRRQRSLKTVCGCSLFADGSNEVIVSPQEILVAIQKALKGTKSNSAAGGNLFSFLFVFSRETVISSSDVSHFYYSNERKKWKQILSSVTSRCVSYKFMLFSWCIWPPSLLAHLFYIRLLIFLPFQQSTIMKDFSKHKINFFSVSVRVWTTSDAFLKSVLFQFLKSSARWVIFFLHSFRSGSYRLVETSFVLET